MGRHMSAKCGLVLLGLIVSLAPGTLIAQGSKEGAAVRKAASSKRGYLGVGLAGNKVAYIGLGSPAEKAGVKSGDRITRIDGEKVSSQNDITAAISRKSAGDTVRMTLERGSAEREVTVTLGDADHATEERAAIQPSTRPAGPPWTKGSGAPPAQDRQCVALKLPDSAAHSDLYGVSFPDALNGWIVGAKGLCLRTTDGGDHWTRLNVDSKATLRAVQFHADGTGWVCGDGDPKAPPPRGLNCHFVSGRSDLAGTLLHTTDGGTTWTTVWLPTNFDVPSLAGTPRGAVVGTSGGDDHLDGDLRRVEQLDESFALSSTSAYRATFALAALNENRWIAVGSPVSVFFFSFTSSPLRSQSKCRILLSADSGKSWEPAKGSEGKGCLRGVASDGPKVAVAVGDGGQILRSEDGGKSWQQVARTGRDDLQAVACGAGGTLVAVGKKGTAVVSKDDGKTWKHLMVGTTADLRGLSATGKFFCLVGVNGAALRLLPD